MEGGDISDHKSLNYGFTQKELNMWQKRWLEVVADYDLDIKYHPDKIHILPNALSRRLVVEKLT